MIKTDFWKQPPAELFAELASSNEGLTSREAASRLLRHGSNDATTPKRPPAWFRFMRRFANPLILVLLLASAQTQSVSCWSRCELPPAVARWQKT
jgi:magnesium-transporting ATPase (P-type)